MDAILAGFGFALGVALFVIAALAIFAIWSTIRDQGAQDDITYMRDWHQ